LVGKILCNTQREILQKIMNALQDLKFSRLKVIYVVYTYKSMSHNSQRTLCFHYIDQSVSGVWGNNGDVQYRMKHIQMTLRPTSYLPMSTKCKETSTGSSSLT
jgi:hypothetical protein